MMAVALAERIIQHHALVVHLAKEIQVTIAISFKFQASKHKVASCKSSHAFLKSYLMMARVILNFAAVSVVIATVVITAVVVRAVLEECNLEEAEQKEKDLECFHSFLEGF